MAIDNGNGSFYNLSPISFSGLANFSANNYTINASPLTTIRWRVWANDSNNQGNTTQTYSFTATAASASVSSCSNLNLADNIYNLTSNVSSGSTCFVVSANNVTLDCKGNAIFFGSGYGVQNDGYNDRSSQVATNSARLMTPFMVKNDIFILERSSGAISRCWKTMAAPARTRPV